MSRMLENVRRQAVAKPPIVMVYGQPGVGKTTWAASSWNPIIICAEDGMASVPDTPHIIVQTAEDAKEAISELLTEEHDFNTVVIDSLDHLEHKMAKALCEKHKWASIESPGYGQGFTHLAEQMIDLFQSLTTLRDGRDMTIILIAHTQLARVESPLLAPYDRYQLKLSKKGSAIAQEKCDAILFLDHKVTVAKVEGKHDKPKAIGRGERIIYTSSLPGLTTKNRYKGMPDILPAPEENGFAEFAQYVPYYNQAGE